MAGITHIQAQEQLQAYLAAELAVLQGQSYQIAGRTLTRADLDHIQSGIKIWHERALRLSALAQGRGRAITVRVR